MPADWADFVPEIGVQDGDYTVTKRQWGAFFGTDLDLQLRRARDSELYCAASQRISGWKAQHGRHFSLAISRFLLQMPCRHLAMKSMKPHCALFSRESVNRERRKSFWNK